MMCPRWYITPDSIKRFCEEVDLNTSQPKNWGRQKKFIILNSSLSRYPFAWLVSLTMAETEAGWLCCDSLDTHLVKRLLFCHTGNHFLWCWWFEWIHLKFSMMQSKDSSRTEERKGLTIVMLSHKQESPAPCKFFTACCMFKLWCPW